MPVWSGFLTPILEVLADGRTWRKRELVGSVSDHVGLTLEQRAEVLPSGQRRAANRIGWALSALSRAELITKPARGAFLITSGGRDSLARFPEGLDERALKTIPAYAEYVPLRAGSTVGAVEATPDAVSDPFEQIETGVERVHAEVAAELLQRMRGQDPAAFEQTVLDVLVAMGYGGTERRAQRIGGSGDGGVDGVIDQDALGLDQIYVQAKRYDQGNNIGRDTVQAFVGALHGVGASRGVFITTSAFTQHAREYAKNVPIRVILIDGHRLAELMIQYGVGVQQRAVLTVVQMDEDYFE
ncbi:restriction endonuclease [Nocardia sp. NPDC056064]|uniref:restriction endonuclease n=1 Tax=Nocardia sp. NPDC056064 TaxID=3345701 RepID=UPI0035DF5EFC